MQMPRRCRGAGADMQQMCSGAESQMCRGAVQRWHMVWMQRDDAEMQHRKKYR